MTTKVRKMAVIALLVAGLGLAGCGSDDKKTVTINGDKVTVDSDGDGVKVETDDGEATFGSGSLPEDFPEDDVPVIEGKIAGGAKSDAGGTTNWSVIIQADGDAEELMAEVTRKLEGAGYTSESAGSFGGSTVAEFTGKYKVGVSIIEVSGTLTVTYLVTALTP